MRRPHVARRLLLPVVLSFLVATGGLSAQQAQTAKPFEPTVGQGGKDVVWVPTPQGVVDKMLDMAKVTQQDFLMDLGSGDGRLVITAAKRGARAQGIEYNPDMVALSRRNATTAGVGGRATFAQADLFQTDFSNATVITMFLLPAINMQLRPKILELKPGTRIVSNTFTMEDWEADETATVTNCERYCNALLWIVPARVGGTWRLPQGELTLNQQFQKFSGRLIAADGAVTPVAQGRLRGTQVTFNAGGVQYTGQVNGETLEATPASGATGTPWRANRVTPAR